MTAPVGRVADLGLPCDTGGMAFRYGVVAVLAVLVTTFALQNTEPVSVRFLVWSRDTVPLAGVVLGSVAVGLVIAGVPLLVTRLRHRSRVRSLEARIAGAETPQNADPNARPSRSA
jgi:uncharacterized integral membrane protein